MVEINAIADNTVLSNFALTKQDEMLKAIFGNYLFASDVVMDELYEGEKTGVLPKRDWSWISVLRLDSETEKHIFDLLSQRFGKGEASCLSLAVSRNLKILTDDLDTRRYAQKRSVPVSGTIGILVIAVKRGLVPLEKGNKLLSQMIENGYYSPYKILDGLL